MVILSIYVSNLNPSYFSVCPRPYRDQFLLVSALRWLKFDGKGVIYIVVIGYVFHLCYLTLLVFYPLKYYDFFIKH
jgi:hypothetical protein